MITNNWKRLQCWPLLLVLILAPAWSQSDRGTITGTVSDASGAVIGSASVVATQISTGAQYKALTNDLGFYSVLNLPIGTYNISFSKAGFKDLHRDGVVVETQHMLQMDATLPVGNTTETIQVTGTPILELQTEVGTNMDSQAMTDLPLSVNGGRDITSFAFAITPNVSGSEWSSKIAGSQAFTKSVMIDGTSTDSGIVGHIAESEPSMDAVQESQVDTAGLRAEDGRSGGGAFLYELKSGTNAFHGSVFGFLANEFLDANTWDNKWYLSQCGSGPTCAYNGHPRRTYERAMNRYFDYGFSGGGPVWKKRKMYIFAAYEKYMQADWRESPNTGTVPSTKMLTGDFSEMLPAAANAHINDKWSDGTPKCTTSPCAILPSKGAAPYTDSAGNTIYYGSIFSPGGTVYPGNIITDPISPLAQKVAAFYQKYYQPTAPGVTRNYPSLSNNNPWFHQTQLSLKYDWDARSNDHIASSYIYNLRPRYSVDIAGGGSPSQVLWQAGTQNGGPLSFGVVQTVINNEYRISESHTFNTNMVNILAFTFNQFQNKSVPTGNTSNWPEQLGFGDIDKLKDFPYIKFGGSPNGIGESPIGNYYAGGYVAYNGIVNDSFSWTKGRHTMKFGAEYRALGFNSDSTGGALQFNFSNTTFAPTNSKVQPYVGSAFANFLLGEVQSASQGTTFNLYSRRKELSFFAQDDVRINSRLTVSADLRWELTRPLHALHGTWSNFDVNAKSQAYNNLPGAVTWLNDPDGSFETYTDWHQFAPKLGFSYQVSSKIVARASFGLNYVPLGWNGYSGVPYGATVGYAAVNRVQQVSAKAPAFQWDGGYPGVTVPPTGPNPKSSYIPWGPTYVDPHSRQLGLTENWFAGVQYQLPANAKIEVSYLGNTGRNLHDGGLNPTNFPTWSTYQKLLTSSHLWDWVWSQASANAAGVPYPYPGFSGQTWFAINPYPQVQACYCGGVFFTNSPLGQSGYNAFTIEGSKQRGNLVLDLSYNWGRTTGNTNSAFFDTWSFKHWYQDPYKYKWEAHWPYTNQTVKGYATYMLPFGRGRKYLSNSRLDDYLFGGWTLGTVISYGNAGQMSAVGSSNYYPGWSAVYTDVAAHPNFKNQFKHYNPGWNPTAAGASSDSDSLFVDPSNFSNPAYGQLGNSPTMFSNWRGWAAPQESASLLKKTRFGEDNRYTLTLRAEFFDLFNRHYWDKPNLSYGTAYFGHVTGVSGNRTGQLGARFEW
jgi:hypothetical protein